MKEIKTTKNYEIFKKLKGNRPVSELRIRKIISSINAVGYITSPLIVNEKLEIIDGQGRFEALKELDLPIEYIVQEGIGIDECIAMNINQMNWSLSDYIESYAERGNESYQKIIKLQEKYPKANLNILFTALCRIQSSPIISVKDGTLAITHQQYEKAIQALDYAYDFLSELDKDRLKGSLFNVVQAMIFCYEYPQVDKERLKSQIKKYIYSSYAWVDMENCMQEIEEIYNRNTRKPVYIFTLFRQERSQIKSKNGRLHASDLNRGEDNKNFVKSEDKKHKFSTYDIELKHNQENKFNII